VSRAYDTVFSENAGPTPIKQKPDSAFMPEFCSCGPTLLSDNVAGSVTSHKTRLCMNSLDLAAKELFKTLLHIQKYRKFKARRSCVKNK
jgi:hypothetical protein